MRFSRPIVPLRVLTVAVGSVEPPALTYPPCRGTQSQAVGPRSRLSPGRRGGGLERGLSRSDPADAGVSMVIRVFEAKFDRPEKRISILKSDGLERECEIKKLTDELNFQTKLNINLRIQMKAWL